MKIYLDVCTICRPFDDQNDMRIRTETDAFYLIVRKIMLEEYTMVISPVHKREIEDINDPYEKSVLMLFLQQYGKSIRNREGIRERAEMLNAKGMGIADAAHVAFAEQSADRFITCDDRLLRQCNRMSVNVSSMNPLEFCSKEDLK